jgi:tripartite ATP-independent transporter DctP family solute receptor
MMAKYAKVMGCLIALTFFLVGNAANSPASETTHFKKEYKLTLNVGPSFYWGMGATRFAELVKAKTHGKINIKPYYSSSLMRGAQLKSPQMVATGVIDCAYESTINTSTVIPAMNIFSLPFFINNFKNLDKMEHGRTGADLFAAMNKIGLHGLAWAENGFREITNSKRAIRTPEDLKGLRIRVVGSPIFIDIFRQLGADPVNMNWGDAVTAFQQGVVDGQENPVGILVPLQIWQYHKYVTFWNYLVDPLIIYWNKKEWDAFPKNIQEEITEAARESAAYEKALCRAGLDGKRSIDILKNRFHTTMAVPDPIEHFKEKGMTVTFLDKQQLDAFKKATRPVYKKWVPKIGRKIYNDAKRDMGE